MSTASKSSGSLPQGASSRVAASSIARELTPVAPTKRSYVTPDSSVSPALLPKDLKDSRDGYPGSDDDDMGDFYMDGLDDTSGRVDCRAADSSPFLDASGVRVEEDPAVAPLTLAETYLPAVFAEHGPCAIRHLTQYLATKNLTFAALPTGKQRRLIVKALELRKGVAFEKVGWGRWNQVDGRSDTVPFTPESMPQSYVRNSSLLGSSLKNPVHAPGMIGNHRLPIMGTYPVSSFTSHHEFMFSPSLSVAETNREDEDDGDIDPLDLDMEGDESETDEEDWKSLGAEALRSRANASTSNSFRESGSYLGTSQRSMPYPIKRKSSAGIYQMNSPNVHVGSFAGSPVMPRPSFPKTSSYLKSSPMSNARASSITRVKDSRAQQISPIRTNETKTSEKALGEFDQADAVAALVMLSGSRDDH